MSCQMNMVLPQTGQTVKVEVTPFFYDIVRPETGHFELFTHGTEHGVRKAVGNTILHCADAESAEFIADALNFYSRAILLNGNHKER